MRITYKRSSISLVAAIERRRYENVVTSRSSPADFSDSTPRSPASREDSESCRDRCHAWYLMSTCVRALRPRAHAIPVLLYTSTLAALTTCAPSRFPLPPPSPRHSLSGTRRIPLPPATLSFLPPPRSERTYRAGVVAALCTWRERDAVKIQPSFLKRARSIVRSFSKGSRGIACPKPFISVSAEVRPSRLAREREPHRSLDKVSRRHNEEAAASRKLADVSISCLRRRATHGHSPA